MVKPKKEPGLFQVQDGNDHKLYLEGVRFGPRKLPKQENNIVLEE